MILKATPTHLPRTLAIIITIVLAVSLFLPYFGMNREDSEALGVLQDVPTNEAGTTVGEIQEFSLYKLAAYCKEGKLFSSEEDNKTIFILVLVFAGLCLFTLLWALIKKPVMLTLSTVLLGFANWLMTSDGGVFGGVGSHSLYIWKLAYYVYLVCIPILLIISIWLFVAKRLEKRRK